MTEEDSSLCKRLSERIRNLMMPSDGEFENHEKFNDRIEKYKDYVKEEDIRRTRKATIFWSFISILYIYGDLHVNTIKTTGGVSGGATPWGIQIGGVTAEKFLIFLLVITLYYAFQFFFSALKVSMKYKVYRLIHYILTMPGEAVGWEEGGLEIHADKSGKDSEYDLKHERWLFMYKNRVVGFLEHFFAPIIFPALLSLWAVVSLGIKVFC